MTLTPPRVGRRSRPPSNTPSEVGARPCVRRRAVGISSAADDEYGEEAPCPTSSAVAVAREAFSDRLAATVSSWVPATLARQSSNMAAAGSSSGGKVLCQHPDWPLLSTMHDALQYCAPDTMFAASHCERLEFLNYFWPAFRSPYGLDALRDTNSVADLPAPLVQELAERAAEMQAAFDSHPLHSACKTRSQHHHATAGHGAAGGRVVD